jgi:hypothetical protein
MIDRKHCLQTGRAAIYGSKMKSNRAGQQTLINNFDTRLKFSRFFHPKDSQRNRSVPWQLLHAEPLFYAFQTKNGDSALNT